MLKRIILVATIVLVPTAFYVASQFGRLDEMTFSQAVAQTTSDDESDQAPKALVACTIVSLTSDTMNCTDSDGASFNVDYTGKPPDTPFASGMRVHFVGHVHGGADPYFHATQAYIQ